MLGLKVNIKSNGENFYKSVCINVSQFLFCLYSLIINSEFVCFLKKKRKSICIHLIILHCGCSRLSLALSFSFFVQPAFIFFKSGWCSHISSLELIRNYFLLLPYRQIFCACAVSVIPVHILLARRLYIYISIMCLFLSRCMS